jgi:hypothetical protein
MDGFERFLCLASYETGHDFLRQCAELGVRVTLLTLDQYRDAAWPRESLEEVVTMPAGLNGRQILNTVSWMARSRRFDRVVALSGEFLETAAQIREHMRVPGMGTTTAGCYRDRLAQRVIARAFGYQVPKFCRVLNYDELRDYMARVPAPWLLCPRMGASTAITISDPEQLWRTLENLGDDQSHYILGQIVEGDLFRVDAIVSDCEVKFSVVHASGPRTGEITQPGTVHTMHTVDRNSRDARELAAINRALAPSFGMVRGITHAHFLRSHSDGSYYFLEIGAGVGGAFPGETCVGGTFRGDSFVDNLVEAATGVSLWRQWANLEVADLRHTGFAVPDSFEGYAGSVLCSSQGAAPHLEAIADPAIVTRLRTDDHAGLILRAANPERVRNLIGDYAAQFESELTQATARGQ